jgi:hypothetical protein
MVHALLIEKDGDQLRMAEKLPQFFFHTSSHTIQNEDEIDRLRNRGINLDHLQRQFRDGHLPQYTRCIG